MTHGFLQQRASGVSGHDHQGLTGSDAKEGEEYEQYPEPVVEETLDDTEPPRMLTLEFDRLEDIIGPHYSCLLLLF